MAKTLHLELHNRQQAAVLLRETLWPFVQSVLQGGAVWVVTVKRRTRTTQQNSRYWGNGVLAQIAEQARVNGQQYTAEAWHEVFKQMFLGVEELPNGQVVGKSSTKLTTTEFAAFCEKVEAYAATELGVTFFALEDGYE